MYPLLFAKNATEFNTNGIGRLSDVHSCTVEETLNGTYELEMKTGITGAHYSGLEMLSVLQVKANSKSDLQIFDVYNMSKPINGIVTVNARHVRYRLNKNVCMPFSVAMAPAACASTLAGLKNNAVEACPFTFTTDVTTAASYTQSIPASIGERLAGVEGSVLDQFGGQYEFDNFNVILHKHRGSIDTGITIKYGKNLTDLTQEINIANTVVGIVPYWSNADKTETVTLPEKVIYSGKADNYPRKMIMPYDFSGLWSEVPTQEQLRSAAQAYVGQTDFGVPKVSIKLSFVPLWETEEYKDLAPIEELSLGDEVTVLFEELGVSATAQIVGYKYDCLREKYISMDIGNIRSNLATTLNDQNAKTIQTIDFAGTKVLRQANATALEAINNATAWLTGSNGYVVAVKNTDGSWKELLFMDTNDTATAKNVLRINTNGLGFSTTGIDGPYTNAWTIDGNLVASFIKTGILSDLAGKFSLNMTTGALNMADGTFSGTINGSTINGSVINVGTYSSADGALNVYDSSGNLIGSWDKDGISITKGNININGKFIVNSHGVMKCVGATISGDIKVGGSNNSEGTINLYDASGTNFLIIDKDGFHIGTGDNKTLFNQTELHMPYNGGKISTQNLDLANDGTVMAQGSDGGWGTGVTGNTAGNCSFINGICVGIQENVSVASGTLTDQWGTTWRFVDGLLAGINS